MPEELLIILLVLAAIISVPIGIVLIIALWVRLKRLEGQMEVLRRAQGVLTSRLAKPTTAESPTVPTPEPVPPTEEVATPLEFEDEEPGLSQLAKQRARRRRRPLDVESADDESPTSGINVEELLAGRWMTWVGALALIIGAGFAFKYTIDNDLIGEGGRVAIGLLAGMLCFAGGAYAALRDYRILGQGLIGAAAGILYFALFAGFRWYELMPMELAAGGMIIVTAAVLSYAAWFDALSTAIIGMLGGFLTPFMLSTGADHQWELFSYILILDLGVLGVATFRKWQSLQILAFLGTLFVWLGWFDRHYEPEKLSATLILMTLFFVLFALLSVWHNVLRRIAAKPVDFILILATPVIYFIGLYGVTEDRFSFLHGLLAVSMAGSYLGLALFALAKNPAGRPIVVSLGGVAASFLTVAIPLQLTGHWIAIAWAAESLLLVELGLRFDIRPLRYAGFGLLGVVQLILLVYSVSTIDDPRHFQTRMTRVDPVVRDVAPIDFSATAVTDAEPSWLDIFNGRSFSFLASALVMCVLAWEYRKRPAVEMETESTRGPPAATIFGWFVVGVPLTLLAMMIVETYAFSEIHNWFSVTMLGWFSVWAAFTALVLLVLSQKTGPRWVESVSLGVFGLLGLFLAISTLATLAGWRGAWHQLETQHFGESIYRWMFINPRAIGFLAAIAAAVAGVFFYRREVAGEDSSDETLTASPSLIDGSLSLFAHLTTLAMLTTEVYAQGVIHNWGTATALAVTGVWTMYAIVTLLTGIYYRSQMVRLLSLALFVLTTAKVFLYDVWHLDKAIRTFAFMGLGVALLLVSFLYRRYRDRIRAWITPALLFVAISAAFGGLPARTLAGDDAPAEDRATIVQKLKYRWPITPLQKGTDDGPRLARLVVPPELYATAKPGLPDLRLVSVNETTGDVYEIPFVRLQRRDTSKVAKRSAPLLNLSQRGTATEFLLDLGDNVLPVNGIVVDVGSASRNYDRTVTVFGAERKDAEEWNLLTDHGYLLDRTRQNSRLTVSHVDFPQSRFRYYKVVIENGAQPPLVIRGASLFDRVDNVIERTKYAAKVVQQDELTKEKSTQLVLDLGYDRLPANGVVTEIEFTGNFDRSVQIEVTDELADDPRKTRWRSAGSGNLYNIERPGFSAKNLTIKYAETTGRYLRLTIANGDDQPLKIKQITATAIDSLLIAERRQLEAAAGTLALYSGGETVAAATYDLSRTIGRYDAASLPSVELGNMSENPQFGFTPVVPWSEQNKRLLWSITLGGVVLLGLLTILLLRRAAVQGAAIDPEAGTGG